jgi:chromosome partitioning protein
METDPNGKSANEVAQLWSYVADRLEKNFRRTVFNAPGTMAAPVARPGVAAGGFGRKAAV